MNQKKKREHCDCHTHQEHHGPHEHCGCHDHQEHHDPHEHCDCHDHHEHHEHHEHHCHCHEETACACGHDHGQEESSLGLRILRYGLGAIPVILGFLPFLPLPLRIVASVLGYLLFGFEVWRGMILGFTKKQIFTEFTLMCVATVCAFAIGEFADGAAVMYLYSLGETISGNAHARSRRHLSELLELSPESATVLRDGEPLTLRPDEVELGEILLVRSGERIPLDGVVTEGGGCADSSSVTGESKPLELYEGIFCPSGSVLTEGSVCLRVVARASDSVAGRLADAVRQATARKSAAEKRIRRFARVFVPLAFAVAALVFLCGFLLTGRVIDWLRAAAVILVVSCPCSLVLSVPLTYFAGIGAASRCGIVFRGGEVMDQLTHVGAVCFDKTGTLTESQLTFDGAEIYGAQDEEEFLALAYEVLLHSPHAAAVSFCETRQSTRKIQISSVEIRSGRGVRCLADGAEVRFGNAAWMREFGIDLEDSKTTAIFGAREGKLLGCLRFSAHLKKGAVEGIEDLRAIGIQRIALLSGDGEETVALAAREAGISRAFGGLAPHEKAEKFRALSEEQRKEKNSLCAFCGDGLNDSAVIAEADVGIAMGRAGSALTVECADVVLMDDDPRKLARAIRMAKRTARIATQNIVLSLGIKLAVLAIGVLLAVLGKGGIPMGLAIVADVGSALLAVLNALRAAK